VWVKLSEMQENWNDEEYCLLGCDFVGSGTNCQCFRGIFLRPSLWHERFYADVGVIMLRRNIDLTDNIIYFFNFVHHVIFNEAQVFGVRRCSHLQEKMHLNWWTP